MSRENELQGNIIIDEYTEVADGYSVYASTRDFLEQWAKDNARENAEINADDTAEQVAKICKVKVCKNGNLFVGCYNENETKYVNFFVKPAIAISVFKKPIVQREYTTTPQGRKIPMGWNWIDDEVLTDTLKDLQIVYNVKEVEKGDKVIEEKIILEVF